MKKNNRIIWKTSVHYSILLLILTYFICLFHVYSNEAYKSMTKNHESAIVYLFRSLLV